MRIKEALEQLVFLYEDLSAIVNRRWWRWITMWMWFGSAPAIVTYRLNRFLYLLLGKAHHVARLVLWPVFLLLRCLGPVLDINYRADIGPRFMILHATMGVLVSGRAVCGRCLTLTGGNWVASRRRTEPGDIRLGDNVVLRAKAMVLGPIHVGDRCVIGAGAVALTDCAPGSVMVGVPARPISGSRAEATAIVEEGDLAGRSTTDVDEMRLRNP